MQLAQPKAGILKDKRNKAKPGKGIFTPVWMPVLAPAVALLLSSNLISPQAASAQTVGQLHTDSPTSDVPLQAVLKPAHSLKRARVILALGGGGTRGCAHIGVLRVLEREGIPIDGIVGTSIGAIVGGLYAAGVKADDIEHRMLNRSLLKAYQTIPIPLRIALVPIFFVPRIFGHNPYDGLYKGNRFRNYLNNCVPEADRELEALPIPFVAVASNLLDAKPYAISKGNLGLAIQASSAIPVLRRPVPMNGLLLVDGGLQANLPAKQARQLGGDIVIAVDIDEKFTNLSEKEFRRFGSVGKRVLNMVLAKVDEDQVAAADIVIHPVVNGISLLSTKSKDARFAIAQGEEAATAAIPEIRARLDKVAKFKIADQVRDSGNTGGADSLKNTNPSSAE